MDDCIFCHDTGLCDWCHGSGKSGSLNCTKCGGTGKCNMCHGRSSKQGSSRPAASSGSGFGSFGAHGSSNFGPSSHSHGHGPSEDQEENEEMAEARIRREAGEAIAALSGNNPIAKLDALEKLDSFEFHSYRKNAFGPALNTYQNETDPEIKKGLFMIISEFGDIKDFRTKSILEDGLKDIDFGIQCAAAMSLAKYREEAHLVIPKIRELYFYPDINDWTRKSFIDPIIIYDHLTEPLLDLVILQLSSKSFWARRAAKKSLDKLKKKKFNIVGFLVSQLEKGTNDQKIAACEGIGEIGKDATGSVTSLGRLLSDPASEVRAKAAWALMKLEKASAPAETALTNALNDDSPAVSKFALKALNKIKKLSNEQKEQIKEMEELDKEMKKYVSKYKQYFPEKSDEDSEKEGKKGAGIKNYIFLSHALPDFIWVKKAMDVIESWPGCRVWTCERDIPTGGDWLESIYGGLDACNWYVLFWSDKAKTSKWTNEEIREAKTRHVGSNGAKPKISVVNLGMNEWPALLSRYQGAMIKNDADLNQWIQNLKVQIESGENPSGPAPDLNAHAPSTSPKPPESDNGWG